MYKFNNEGLLLFSLIQQHLPVTAAWPLTSRRRLRQLQPTTHKITKYIKQRIKNKIPKNNKLHATTSGTSTTTTTMIHHQTSETEEYNNGNDMTNQNETDVKSNYKTVYKIKLSEKQKLSIINKKQLKRIKLKYN